MYNIIVYMYNYNILNIILYNIIFITKITRTPIYKRQFGTLLFNVKVGDE